MTGVGFFYVVGKVAIGWRMPDIMDITIVEVADASFGKQMAGRIGVDQGRVFAIECYTDHGHWDLVEQGIFCVDMTSFHNFPQQ